MTSTGYTLYLQQSAGKYEDSEEGDFSQESENSSHGTDSSQEEETETLEPWSCILSEAEKRHDTQLNALINEYEGDGDSENVARVKAENALLPVYRKELRKLLLENLQWMRAMKKDGLCLAFLTLYNLTICEKDVICVHPSNCQHGLQEIKS